MPGIANMRLTCKLFARLAKPIIFRNFRFTEIPELGDFQKCKKRLDFWFSDPIAPLVRHCLIRGRGPSIHTAQQNTMIHTFIGRILLFSGLQHLEIFYLHFNDFALDQLSKLQASVHLTIHNCTIFTTHTSRNPVHVARVDIILDMDSRTHSSCLEFLKVVQFTSTPHISLFVVGDKAYVPLLKTHGPPRKSAH